MKELADAIKERINNSFSGPYTIFFMLTNWKIALLILTGQENAQERINSVQNYLNNSGENYFLQPLWATLIYIIVVPLIVYAIDLYRDFIELKKKNSIEKIHAEFNKTWDYKFTVVKKLSERIHLSINSMISNGNPASDQLRDLQKYLIALQEGGNKSLLEHFTDLRGKKEI